MIETTVQLICDGCETVYPAHPNHTGSAVLIRAAAEAAGWTTTGRGRSLQDRCKACPPTARATSSATKGKGSVRLSPPMVELLTDIATNPAMYITSYTRWDRTAQALIDRELATRSKGYAGSHQYELRITDPGRAEAGRRGIGTAPNPTEAPDA